MMTYSNNRNLVRNTGRPRSVDNTNLDRGGPKTYTEIRHWELVMS